MKVTRVKVRLTDEDVVRAYVDITLNDCLVIHGLAVIQHSMGYLLRMPRNKRGEQPYEVAFPMTHEARKIIEGAVLTGVQES